MTVVVPTRPPRGRAVHERGRDVCDWMHARAHCFRIPIPEASVSCQSCCRAYRSDASLPSVVQTVAMDEEHLPPHPWGQLVVYEEGRCDEAFRALQKALDDRVRLLAKWAKATLDVIKESETAVDGEEHLELSVAMMRAGQMSALLLRSELICERLHRHTRKFRAADLTPANTFVWRTMPTHWTALGPGKGVCASGLVSRLVPNMTDAETGAGTHTQATPRPSATDV